MKFQNPTNGYIEESTYCALWCLIFGVFYFLVKGIWTHAIIAAILAFITYGISWVIYPFFATDIISKNYLKRGWIKIDGVLQQPQININ